MRLPLDTACLRTAGEIASAHGGLIAAADVLDRGRRDARCRTRGGHCRTVAGRASTDAGTRSAGRRGVVVVRWPTSAWAREALPVT